MTLNSWIKKKVKQGTFTRKPHPVVPFALFVMILGALIVAYENCSKLMIWIMSVLAGLTLVFAVLHWYVWFVTNKK